MAFSINVYDNVKSPFNNFVEEKQMHSVTHLRLTTRHSIMRYQCINYGFIYICSLKFPKGTFFYKNNIPATAPIAMYTRGCFLNLK